MGTRNFSVLLVVGKIRDLGIPKIGPQPKIGPPFSVLGVRRNLR